MNKNKPTFFISLFLNLLVPVTYFSPVLPFLTILIKVCKMRRYAGLAQPEDGGFCAYQLKTSTCGIPVRKLKLLVVSIYCEPFEWDL